ncbi:hypothetical protein B0H14DRAFT_3141828 [Mycena olivaceomarginata]|nr:hypothetical protein B0H14DRAFT_3141828 [Mycena olivaceomarginata]
MYRHIRRRFAINLKAGGFKSFRKLRQSVLNEIRSSGLTASVYLTYGRDQESTRQPSFVCNRTPERYKQPTRDGARAPSTNDWVSMETGGFVQILARRTGSEIGVWVQQTSKWCKVAAGTIAAAFEIEPSLKSQLRRTSRKVPRRQIERAIPNLNTAADDGFYACTSTEFRGHRSDEPKMNIHLPPTSGKTGDLFLPPSEGQVEVNFLRPDMRSAGVTHHVSGLRFGEALHCGLESKVDFQLDGRRIGLMITMRRVEDAATVESVARGNRLVPRYEKDGEIWERFPMPCEKSVVVDQGVQTLDLWSAVVVRERMAKGIELDGHAAGHILKENIQFEVDDSQDTEKLLIIESLAYEHKHAFQIFSSNAYTQIEVLTVGYELNESLVNDIPVAPLAVHPASHAAARPRAKAAPHRNAVPQCRATRPTPHRCCSAADVRTQEAILRALGEMDEDPAPGPCKGGTIVTPPRRSRRTTASMTPPAIAPVLDFALDLPEPEPGGTTTVLLATLKE